jgi:hypothetical protein
VTVGIYKTEKWTKKNFFANFFTKAKKALRLSLVLSAGDKCSSSNKL